MTRRRRETMLTSGDSRFADQSFALVKVSFLLADMHNDAWLSRTVFVVPPACGSSARIQARLVRRWVLFATANNQCGQERSCNFQYPASIHKAADTIQRVVPHSTLKSVLIG